MESLLDALGIHGWQDGAAVATILGIMVGLLGLFLAGWQLTAQAKLARSEFEDSFSREYRQVVAQIPTKVFLGATLSPQERLAAFRFIYQYIDLCNEQKYLHERRRIGDKTWAEWEDGIMSNLARPELSAAWSYVAHHAVRQKENGEVEKEFESLRRVVEPRVYDGNTAYLPPPVNISDLYTSYVSATPSLTGVAWQVST